MKRKHVVLAVAAVTAVAAASSFAQTVTVPAGQGVLVTSPNSAATVSVGPSVATAVMPNVHLLPGGTVVPIASTTIMGAPPAVAMTSAPVVASAPIASTTVLGGPPSVMVAPSAPVAVAPAPSVTLTPVAPVSSAPVASTTVLGGPGAMTSTTHTVITRYWVNVPANVMERADFRRWRRLIS